MRRYPMVDKGTDGRTDCYVNNRSNGTQVFLPTDEIPGKGPSLSSRPVLGPI
jgi:hypothetical protein